MTVFKNWIASACILVLPTFAQSQDIDTSVIRAAGAVCAAGFSAEIQGELDVSLNNMFSGVGTSNGSSVNADQAGTLLESLSSQPKDDAHASYAACLSQTLQSVLSVSAAATDVDTGREVIHSNLVPDPLGIMQSGDRFQMKRGESRAVGSQLLLFSLKDVDVHYKNGKFVNVNVADVLAGKNANGTVYQGNSLKLNEACSLTPYSIKVKEKLVSFLVYCK